MNKSSAEKTTFVVSLVKIRYATEMSTVSSRIVTPTKNDLPQQSQQHMAAMAATPTMSSMTSPRSSSTRRPPSQRTEAVLRLRWTVGGASKIISQRSVEDLSELTKFSNVDRHSQILPEQVPFELTKAQTLSMIIPMRVNSISTSFQNNVDKIVTTTKIRPLLNMCHWIASGLNPLECFRDRYDGSLPPSKTVYFTYWMTIVHVMVFVASFTIFGFTNFGFSYSEYKGLVKMPYMKSERKIYYERQNPWIGPSEAHLVLLGAHYPPCMRRYPSSDQALEDTARELNSACCSRLDGSGCFQSDKESCVVHEDARWIKWSTNIPGPERRTYGAVCGLDPRFCEGQSDYFTNRWPEKITEWPVCENVSTPDLLVGKRHLRVQEGHMFCEIQARPCCYGIQSRCMMTTWEHCDLLRGTYHPNKFLCAQAECLKDTCGMSNDAPNQWHRVFTSLFVHEGVIPLVFSIWFQLSVMARLEYAIGVLIVPLFIGAGYLANITGGYLMPYTLRAGPSSVHFGVLACLQVLIYLKPPQRNPVSFLMPSVFLQTSILLLGVLPWVDFYGNLFGMVYGYLYSFLVLVPKTAIFKIEKRKKGIMVFSFWGLVLIIPAMSICFFGISTFMAPVALPKLSIAYISYLECIPFSKDFCRVIDPAEGYTRSNQTM